MTKPSKMAQEQLAAMVLAKAENAEPPQLLANETASKRPMAQKIKAMRSISLASKRNASAAASIDFSDAAPVEMVSQKSGMKKNVSALLTSHRKSKAAPFQASTPPLAPSASLAQAAPVVMQSSSAKVVKKVGLSKPSTPGSTPSTPEKKVKSAVPPPPKALPASLHRDRKRRSTIETEKPIKYFVEAEQPKDKVVGVVVTIFQGSSYDTMFRETRPTTVPGERVNTYSISCAAVGRLHHHLTTLVPLRSMGAISKLPGTALELLHAFLADDTWRSLVEDIRSVPADSVVFNWECCSACGTNAFPCPDVDCSRGSRAASVTMPFMGFALRSGYTVMCSDFSLKSLLVEWSEAELGPNPFLQIGSCSNQFCLKFIPSELQQEEVPQQLQVVGELCSENGQAIVSAMGDTIVYTVNPQRTTTDRYDLKVLTVVTDMSSSHVNRTGVFKCAIGSGESLSSGWAGHVTLTYKEGGQLITSMGHWAELSKIDTSLESVLRAAQKNFGVEESRSFQTELASASNDVERSEVIQKRAKKMVSMSAPSRMKARTKCSD